MEWIFRGIGLLALLFVVKTALNNKQKSKTEDESIIKLPYRLKEIGVALTAMSSLGVLFLSFLMNESEDKTIALATFTISVIIFLMFIVVDSRFKNVIFDDHIVIHKLFSRRTIQYSELSYTLDGHNLVILCSKSHKRFYINYSYRNTDLLMKSIENYHKKNNIDNMYSSDIVRGNFYTRNFGITFTVISIFVALIVIIIVCDSSSNEIVFAYVFGVLFGLLPLLVGVFFLLLYYNFSITINSEKLIRKSILRIRKEYNLSDLKVIKTTNGLKIYYNAKFLLYLNTWFFDNTYSLETKLKKKK